MNCKDEENCAKMLSNFRKATHFVQIRSEKDYTTLATKTKLIKELYVASDLKEVGRVFYLAVPPSGYRDITQNIHLYARPSEKET